MALVLLPGLAVAVVAEPGAQTVVVLHPAQRVGQRAQPVAEQVVMARYMAMAAVMQEGLLLAEIEGAAAAAAALLCNVAKQQAAVVAVVEAQ